MPSPYLPPSPELWLRPPAPLDAGRTPEAEPAFPALPGREEQEQTARQLQDLLHQAGLAATVTAAISTPAFLRLEISLSPGTSLEELNPLRQEIQRRLARPRPPRMLLPIPGRDRAGIEIPNLHPGRHTPEELFLDPDWPLSPGELPLLLGRDTVRLLTLDLAKEGNLLAAGYDSQGLGSLLRQFLLSLLSRQSPGEARLLLFSSQQETFRPFAKLPHLLLPPQKEAEAALGTLEWCLQETVRRRRLLAAAGARSLAEYQGTGEGDRPRLPRILWMAADLDALLAPRCARRAQELLLALSEAGAVGIHVVAATTGVLPEALRNAFSCRICGHLPKDGTARERLDIQEAECLQDQGDFLLHTGEGETLRLQTAHFSLELCTRAAECACASQPFHPQAELQTFLHRFLEGRRALQEANLEKGMPQLQFAEPTADDALKCVLAAGQARPDLLASALGVTRERAENLLDELAFHEYLGAPDATGARPIQKEKLPPGALGEAAPTRKTLESLLEELSRKIAAGDPGSRTVAEYNKGVHAIGKKIVEEAAEVWMAAEYEKPESLSLEISQLLYHLMVLMLKKKLTLEDIYRQL